MPFKDILSKTCNIDIGLKLFISDSALALYLGIFLAVSQALGNFPERTLWWIIYVAEVDQLIEGCLQ